MKRKMKRYSKFSSVLMFVQTTVDPDVKIQTCMVVFTSSQGLQTMNNVMKLARKQTKNPNLTDFAQERIPSKTTSPVYTLTGYLTCTFQELMCTDML